MSSDTSSTAAAEPARPRVEPPPASLPPLERLRRIVHLLRAPGGCPWDREQTHASLAPLLLEEAYETAEAIESGHVGHMCEELGDLLLHVVMHGEIGAGSGAFTLEDIAATVVEKMIRRHPHVFGTAAAGDSESVLRQWDDIKRGEKAHGADGPEAPDPGRPHLAGVSHGLPALIRAHKLQKRAAKVGFEFPAVTDALDKVREELAEVEQALADTTWQADAATGEPSPTDAADALAAELGDLLFSVVNVTRLLGHDAESLLTAANRKFERRFAAMERRLQAAGTTLAGAGLDTMEAAWQAAKGDPGEPTGGHDPA